MLKNLLDSLKGLVRGSAGNDWDYNDRRRLIRLSCDCEVTVTTGSAVFQGRALDMSVQGMQVRCFGVLKQGQTVKVKYLAPTLGAELDTVTCKVVWVAQEGQQCRAGLLFQEDQAVMSRSWVKPVLQELGMEASRIKEKRKAVRLECFLPCQVTPDGEEPRDAVVHDLGLGGARVEIGGDTLGEGLFLVVHLGPMEKLPRLDARGTINSVREKFGVYHYGVTFEEFSDQDARILERYLGRLIARGRSRT